MGCLHADESCRTAPPPTDVRHLAVGVTHLQHRSAALLKKASLTGDATAFNAHSIKIIIVIE